MKKIISLSTVLLGALLFVGCGSSSKTKSFEEISVDFNKKSAKYDFKDYLVDQNQTNNYKIDIFTNDKGKKSYSKTPDDTAYTATKYEIQGNKINEYEDGKLSNHSVIQATKIINYDDENHTQIAYVRHFDIGDYIVKTHQTNDDNITLQLLCKAKKILSDKEVNGRTYHDVLLVECTGKGEKTKNVGGVDITSSSNFTSTTYLAKGDDYILSVDERCDKTEGNNQLIKGSCTKIITSLTTINN